MLFETVWRLKRRLSSRDRKIGLYSLRTHISDYQVNFYFLSVDWYEGSTNNSLFNKQYLPLVKAVSVMESVDITLKLHHISRYYKIYNMPTLNKHLLSNLCVSLFLYALWTSTFFFLFAICVKLIYTSYIHKCIHSCTQDYVAKSVFFPPSHLTRNNHH